MRVLVTRAAGTNGALRRALEAGGAEVVEVPLIGFEATGAPWPAAWDVMAFTSATAVRFWNGPLSGFVAAVGPSTAKALGGRADLVPKTALATELAEALTRALGDLSGVRVCHPRAEVSPPAFDEALRAAGAEVLSVPLYRTVMPAGAREDLLAALPVDRVALASGSAARHLASVTTEPPVVCIGPSTEEVARQLGLRVLGVASPHSSEGLAAACLEAG